ncbi:GPW/gp25 family protein [Aliifodinibius sp. S!AR15-10]|uniref:GPW/gp25 family protein n=1 Tax=Aliifodinibius sp. S!AR15-10 TaxID=2950437 RepID=UPI00285F31FF|nr:GPW/gp25 family protein [Aliifodinibius sp. S!AR15-10]MDR8390612.1 GPW/gp25 family protein [Aliifodinibius sp. S!AR15-10]
MAKQQEQGKAFLGRGWKFPVQFKNGSANLSQYERDIKESLTILLSTTRGERVMRPDYGTTVHDLMFEPLDVSTATLVGEEIKKAILLHEPRVFVENVEAVQESLTGFIEVTIEYTIIATNTRANLVFPFYLNEGTDIEQ